MIRKSVTYRKSYQRSYWASGAPGPSFTTNDIPYIMDRSEVLKSASPPDWKLRLARNQQAGSTLTGFNRDAVQFRYLLRCRRHFDLFNGDYRREVELNWMDPAFMLVDPASQPNYLNNLSTGTANAGALTGLVKNIRGAQTAFQGGVFLGELGETLKMLKSPAQGLRRGLDGYLSSLKKVKRIPSIPQRRSALADTWLEHSFGWTPFLSDIEEANEVLENVHSKDTYQKVFGEGTDSSSWSGILTSIGTGLNNVVIEGEIVYTTKVKYYGTCASWNSNPYSARSLGLDLSNFVPTAWELIPYSFLVDYFSNIGEAISALSLATSGVRWLMQGVEKTAELKCGRIYSTLTSPSVWIQESESILQRPRGHLRMIYRTPYNGSLVPNVRFEIPGMGLKWLNMAALARNHRALLPFF